TLRRYELARELVERFVDERRLALERFVQRIERRRARGEPFGVTCELEARVDAGTPNVREIVDIEARQVAGLLGRAERAERRRELLVDVGVLRRRRRAKVREPRPLGQERAADDPQREARIAALQEADRRLHRFDVTLGMREEMCDLRRRALAPRYLARAPAQLAGHPLHERRRVQPQKQPERSVRLRDGEAELGRVQAQEAGEIRRRGVRRVELSHRRRDEQDAHGGERSAPPGAQRRESGRHIAAPLALRLRTVDLELGSEAEMPDVDVVSAVDAEAQGHRLLEVPTSVGGHARIAAALVEVDVLERSVELEVLADTRADARAEPEAVVVHVERTDVDLAVDVRQRADEVERRVDRVVEAPSDLVLTPVHAGVVALLLPLAEQEHFLAELVRPCDRKAVAVHVDDVIERQIQVLEVHVAVAHVRERRSRSQRQSQRTNECYTGHFHLPQWKLRGASWTSPPG